MARMARQVFPGVPHHVTQRGNGRAQTFFSDDDYGAYRDLLAQNARAAGVEVWSWVLMPNHVHLILVPPDADSLRKVLAATHRRYAGRIHARLGRTGHFWQGRFGCVAMDEAHLAAAVRYVAMNPVRARLVARAADWRWSSARVLLGRVEDDGLTTPGPVAARYPDFARMLEAAEDEALVKSLRRAESVGRPVGAQDFIRRLEIESGRVLRPARRGRPPKARAEGE